MYGVTIMPRYLQDIKGSPAPYVTTIDYLRGVDLTSSPINVAQGRAYDAPNMIRDVPGKVRKRMGYGLYRSYGAKINGIYKYDNTLLVHAGTKLYKDGDTPTQVLTGMPDHLSNAYRVGDKMIILTGTTMYCYYEEGGVSTCGTAESMATVPEVTVGRPPGGGGDTYPFNMLTSKYTDCFLGTANDTVYRLSYYPLKDSNIKVEKLNNDASWTTLTTGYTVNTTTGEVTFSTAPGVSPISGEDNIKITAEVADTSDLKAQVNGCQFGIVYGTAGSMDRVFISGNPDEPNYDWFSAVNDPLFFGDVNYGQIGKQGSDITGYSIINGNLATHKANDDNGRNIFIRVGQLDLETEDLTPVEFPVTQIIQGSGAIAPGSFAYVTEPLYLTADGVYAATPYEFNGLFYAQRRSFYLDGMLKSEEHPENAKAIAWNDFYAVALNGKVYILDTLQRDSVSAVRASMYQYEGYYFTNVPVNVWFVMDGVLCFGSEDGNIYAFHTDKYDTHSYSDNGKVINARWDFMHTGTNLYLDKTMNWISLNVATTPYSSFELYYRRTNDSSYVKLAIDMLLRYFAYSSLNYGSFVYGGSQDAWTIGRRLKIKRYDACHLSLRNTVKDEGLFIFAITLEYVEGRNYKTLREM